MSWMNAIGLVLTALPVSVSHASGSDTHYWSLYTLSVGFSLLLRQLCGINPVIIKLAGMSFHHQLNAYVITLLSPNHCYSASSTNCWQLRNYYRL